MANRSKKLENVLARARELSEKDALDEVETKELDSVMAEAKSLRDKIVQERSIDEFTRTLSEDTPAKDVERQSDVVLGLVEGRQYEAVADRKAFARAVKTWRGKTREPWGFDIRYKVAGVGAGVTAETNAEALTLEGTDPGEQYGGAVAPFYYPGIVEPPTRTPVVADLFAQGATESNLVRLVKETVTVKGARARQEGEAYSASQIEVAPVDWPVKDIVTLLPVTEDVLMDIPAMSAYLSMRLAKFVQLREEEELLAGDGTGAHLVGLQNLDDRTIAAQGADDIDTAVMKLMAKVFKNSFLDPQWVLMSPTTWSQYVTLRTNLNGGLGQFLAGPPTLAAVRTIWGLPITVSPVVPDDRVFCGNSAAGMIFRNGGLRVESSTGYGTYFGEGLVAIRGKVRVAFAVFRPQGIGELILGS
jgi:HK97 family phage major capsid protein